MNNPVQKIETSKLCALTGLTAPEIEAIARRGFLPRAKRGEYPLTAALSGLFKFYLEKKGPGQHLKSVRWSLHMAATEFDLDDKTLAKQIRSAGVTAGPDGCFSTLDICRAVFGDLRGDLIRAQTRDANGAADIKAIKKAVMLRENIPAELVERSWSGVLVELRQKILYAELPDNLKQEILRDLQTVPVENYFTNSNASFEAAAEDVPAAA